MTPRDCVMEFHTAFELPILAAPEFPSADRRRLRIDLFEEELFETLKASFDDDAVEFADGLGDMVYILWGTALEYGLWKTLQRAYIKSDVGSAHILDAWGKLRTAETKDDLAGVHYLLSVLLGVVYASAKAQDIPLDDVVEAIHASNMSKLVAGKPVINDGVLRPDLPVGKVLKGPDYFKPTAKISVLLGLS